MGMEWTGKEGLYDTNWNSWLHEAPRVFAAQGKQGQLPALRIAEQGAVQAGDGMLVQEMC